jgi:hypothetical protein
VFDFETWLNESHVSGLAVSTYTRYSSETIKGTVESHDKKRWLLVIILMMEKNDYDGKGSDERVMMSVTMGNDGRN